MNVNPYITTDYERKRDWTLGESKPNSNPIKPNLRKAKMNINSFITKDYRKKDDFTAQKNKPNSKPISKWEKMFGGRRILVPTPLLVDALIRKVGKRKLITIKQIREQLAKDFKADSTCPLTTGIFIRIIAEAAEEDLQIGKKRITSYWRVIKSDGSLNPKFPGGVTAQAARLKEEGHEIICDKGKKPPKVQDFEKFLV